VLSTRNTAKRNREKEAKETVLKIPPSKAVPNSLLEKLCPKEPEFHYHQVHENAMLSEENIQQRHENPRSAPAKGHSKGNAVQCST
jgi:hypothetical protein